MQIMCKNCAFMLFPCKELVSLGMALVTAVKQCVDIGARCVEVFNDFIAFLNSRRWFMLCRTVPISPPETCESYEVTKGELVPGDITGPPCPWGI
jgi:hypothetical protein